MNYEALIVWSWEEPFGHTVKDYAIERAECERQFFFEEMNIYWKMKNLFGASACASVVLVFFFLCYSILC